MPSVQGDDTNGLGFGVQGTSTTAIGVIGISDQADGVQGETRAPNGIGVRGIAPQTGAGVAGQSDTGVGVIGSSNSGVGVTGGSNNGIGVSGESSQGIGVSGLSKETNGVLGISLSDSGSGVFGSHPSVGNGVTGLSEGGGFGVLGQSNRSANEDRLSAGVAGRCDGLGWGVLGQSPEGRAGVRGEGRFGVHGIAPSSDTSGVGVEGEGHVGVHGVATTQDMGGAGVRGDNPVSGAAGVLGVGPDGFGVAGVSSAGQTFVLPTHGGIGGVSDRGPGVVGVGLNGNAAILGFGDINAIGKVSAMGGAAFMGTVSVFGTLTALVKQFQIDHPLDAANKFLNHASVESSEMKTIYDGVVALDAQGTAVVELPAWFEALNTSVRYQLTAVGAPAPNLHVANELSANRFTIAGGPASLSVCWQVTGVRHDAVARAHPLVVEEDKPADERGYYLYPEQQDQTSDRGIAAVRHAALFNAEEERQRRSSSRA
jgi:hypothetical protein